MFSGIGTDILKIDRFVPVIDSKNRTLDCFIQKTYTKNEIKLAENRENPLYCYATRFSGKEAVFKALGIHGDDIRLNEIEILEKATGQPYVILHGNADKIAKEKGIRQILISLSYEDDYAIAFALCE